MRSSASRLPGATNWSAHRESHPLGIYDGGPGALRSRALSLDPSLRTSAKRAPPTSASGAAAIAQATKPPLPPALRWLASPRFLLTDAAREHSKNGWVRGVVMRTLLRPGRRGILIKIESRGGARFLVGGPQPKDRRTFFDFEAALQSFEDIECGRQVNFEARLDGATQRGRASEVGAWSETPEPRISSQGAREGRARGAAARRGAR